MTTAEPSASHEGDAFAALAREVARQRAADPLAPVTVVVPSRRAGLAARRDLAAATPRGLANVRFVTVGHLAELLAGPALARAGLKPLTGAVAREALRAELVAAQRQPGPALTNPRTLDALGATFDQLRHVASLTRRAPQAGAGRSWLLELFARTQQRLRGHSMPAELVAAVGDAVRDDPGRLAELGAVLAWCPNPTDHHARRLLQAVGPSVTTIAPPDAVVAPTEVLAATDPDAEVREVVRRLLAWAADGVAWHRMAVAHPAADPYAALVHQHLTAAGIAHNGPGTTTLAGTSPGRLLSGALRLAGSELRRTDVMAWLAAAPVHDRAGPHPGEVPATWWDVLSRRAGVVAGADQWARRLAALAERDPAATHGRLSARDVAEAPALAAFIARLAELLTPPAAGSSWSAWIDWSSDLFAQLELPAWRRRRAAPPTGADAPGEARLDAELEAREAVHASLEALRALDDVGDPPTLDAFRDAVDVALRTPIGRLGAFGTGVFVVPLREAATLPLDAVAVLGAVEGRLPHHVDPDPLLDAALATELEAVLGSPAERTERQRTGFRWALAAGRRHRLVSFPRAELRSRRTPQPSRWLLDAVEPLAGRRLAGSELLGDAGRALPLRVVASWGAALRGEPKVSLQERRLAALCSGDVDPPFAAPALAHPGLARGLSAARQRAAGVLGPYTGRVAPELVAAFDPDHPVSPTSLEHDAACPRRYLLGRLLGLEEIERPEDIVELTPLERGTLVHAILERYVAGLLATPPLERSLERLLAIAEELFAELEARGVTGRPLGWAGAKRALRRDLAALHRRDTAEPVAVEVPFGLDGRPAVQVALDDGTSLAFRGRIDRIDRDGDGLVVTDYKTGSDARYRRLHETTVEGGTLLQLPVYALAARTREAGDDGATTPVEAAYWFLSAKANYRRRGYALDDARLATFRSTVATLADQITGGLFPGRPERPVAGRAPEDTCRHCPFDPICPAERATEWEPLARRPELAAYVSLSPSDGGEAS